MDDDGVKTGRVKWFSPPRGFGFVVRDDGGGDVFVGARDIEESPEDPLRQGEHVVFNLGRDRQNRVKATMVHRFKEAPEG